MIAFVAGLMGDAIKGGELKMKISIKVAGALTRLLQQKQMTIEIEDGQDLLSLIDALEAMHSGIKGELCDHDSHIKDSINVYVNGDNVRYLEGLSTSLKDGDKINIIPAAAAG